METLKSCLEMHGTTGQTLDTTGAAWRFFKYSLEMYGAAWRPLKYCLEMHGTAWKHRVNFKYYRSRMEPH